MKRLALCLLPLFAAGCAVVGIEPMKTAAPATSIRMELKDPPLIGTTPAGEKLYLGGLSGLRYLGKSKSGKLRFLTHTDRGPNTDEYQEGSDTVRPFLLPTFQPRIVILEADPAAGTLAIEKQIPLRRPDGKKLTGIPQKAGQEKPVDSVKKPVAYDPYGMDLEGIALALDGSYWAVEEYGPTVARFSADGKLLEMLKPGSGLPKVFEHRRLNRGFEGGALLGNRFYVVIQSPLDNPKSEDEKNSKKSSLIRIAEVDIAGRRTLGQYAYALSGGDRIGDIAVEGPRSLLVIEQDGKNFKRVFRASLDGATNLQLLPDRVAGSGGTLELLSASELAAAGVKPARKEELLDLAAAGMKEEKVEGIDIVEGQLALLIDNDFGLDGSWDSARAGFKNEPSALYIFPASEWNK